MQFLLKLLQACPPSLDLAFCFPSSQVVAVVVTAVVAVVIHGVAVVAVMP